MEANESKRELTGTKGCQWGKWGLLNNGGQWEPMEVNGDQWGQWEPMGTNADTTSFIMLFVSSAGSMGVNGS